MDKVYVNSYQERAALREESFPWAEAFRVELQSSSTFGGHVRFVGAGDAPLAGFPYWDHADADLLAKGSEAVPTGTFDEPFSDTGQGWHILIWRRVDTVVVMEGGKEFCTYERMFRVPASTYLDAWERVIHEVRACPRSFRSLALARQHIATAEHLVLNFQDLDELPVDIGVFRGVVGISAIKNRLCTLPESIGDLERLERLDLRFNRIQRLPASMSRLTCLTSVNLADNELSEIPDWVHRLPALRSFFIPGRRQRVPEAQKRRLRAARPELEIDHDFVPPFAKT